MTSERELYYYIRWNIDNLDRPPTLREMKEYLGLKSDNSILRRLKKLEDEGWIVREPGLSRSIQILK